MWAQANTAPHLVLVDDSSAGETDDLAHDAEPGSLVALSDERVRILFGTSLGALLLVDDDRRYVQVNAAGAELLGAAEEDIVGRKIENFTPPEQLARLEVLWSQLRRDGRLEGDYEVLQGNGSRTFVHFRARWGFAAGQHLIAAAETPSPDPAALARVPRDLTAREREVLQLAAHGYTGEEIASLLMISPATIKSHFANIYAKLEARDRAEAVAKALRAGLIS